MKTIIMSCAILLSTSLLTAQTTNKPATVRIKKIEKINGVEKITDTTFTTNDPANIKLDEGTFDIVGKLVDEDNLKTIIINDSSTKFSDISAMALDKEIEAEIQKALKEAGLDEKNVNSNKIVMIRHDDKTSDDAKKETYMSKSIIIKRIDITDANTNDMKRIGQSAGDNNKKLKIDNMNFYPNPNNGKFNLSFNLPEKGDAEISILNTEGKIVFKEKLANFTGAYDKEIDISKNAKGIYFVKIEQGQNTQVKKIILE